MESRVVVDQGEHATLRKGDRGLDEVGPLRMNHIAATASTSTGIVVACTGDDTHTEEAQYDLSKQPSFHHEYPSFF